MFYKTDYNAPIGRMMIVSDDMRIAGVWLEGQKYFGGVIGEDLLRQDDLPVLQEAKSWLDRYFAGNKPQISELPLAPRGNAFRQAVWRILCAIPYGEVVTYGDIAKEIAQQRGIKTMSAQAIGGAVGHNPISVIIPCHRVVGANGNLTGYAGGLEVKIKLLMHEGVDMEKFSRPIGRMAL